MSAQIIEIRRVLHQRPELCYEERETAAFIATHLRDLGLGVREGVAGTGVVALLRGKGRRADGGCAR